MTIVLQARNVCGLLALGADHLAHQGERCESRAGPVIAVPTPVMSVYERPTERVLQSSRRDANPFFHLAESLWMLSGRDDSAFLDHYVRDFGSRFAETGGIIHGAYGDRWRRRFGVDQLDAAVRRLRENQDDRQIVLQMWDCRDQAHVVEYLGKVQTGENDLLGSWRDRPCNTHVYLRVRREPAGHKMGVPFYNLLLDLTVCCRSNDIVYGAYGANAVHFSVLQEYLAGRIGVGVGRMYQLSNNFHGYVEVLNVIGDPRHLLEEVDLYEEGEITAMPIGEVWDCWDADLGIFTRWHDDLWGLPPDADWFDYPDGAANLWFPTVAAPVCQSMWLWRAGRRRDAAEWCSQIEASDWRQACEEWMIRRINK
jgi:thymidylate synthase